MCSFIRFVKPWILGRFFDRNVPTRGSLKLWTEPPKKLSRRLLASVTIKCRKRFAKGYAALVLVTIKDWLILRTPSMVIPLSVIPRNSCFSTLSDSPVLPVFPRSSLSHFFRLRFRSCSKIFEFRSGESENFSNSKIRLQFRLRLPSMQPKFTNVFI